MTHPSRKFLADFKWFGGGFGAVAALLLIPTSGWLLATRSVGDLDSPSPDPFGHRASIPWQDEVPVFSGPQPGERLPPFRFREILVDPETRERDLVTQAAGTPLLLIFVHEANRPSIAMTRILTGYAKSRAVDGLTTGVIFLDRDPTDAEAKLKRMQHALTAGVPTGVSLDGHEGPGSLGLNRQVTLTILIANQHEVTANFALVQPSLQADLPRILESLVGVIGGRAPRWEELEGQPGMAARPQTAAEAPNLRPLLSPLIQKTATEAQVIAAAEAVEKAASADPATRSEVGRISRTIVEAGVLENYGTRAAQGYLKKWASEYGGLEDKNRPR